MPSAKDEEKDNDDPRACLSATPCEGEPEIFFVYNNFCHIDNIQRPRE
jgi:hypothetical protein